MQMPDWKPHEIALIKAQWSTRTSGQLAKELHKSRSAVGGKVHRMRKAGMLPISSGPKQLDVDPRKAAARARAKVEVKPPKPKPPPKPKARPPTWQERMALAAIEADGMAHMLLNGAPVFECTLLDLDSTTCRWPVADDARGIISKYCGLPPVEGRPYCDEHCRRAFTFTREKTDAKS